MDLPRVLAVATAAPPHAVTQAEVRQAVEALFSPMVGLERMLAVFENTGIVKRHLSAPLNWFRQTRSFAEKNQVWFEVALGLCERAAKEALAKAQVPPQEVGAVVLVTTTGIATPSLEAHLLQRLGLPLGALRLPLWGLGCAGGAAGLARAADLARLYPNRPVLLLAVELCSLTFLQGDLSKSNLVATSLFADGAAAVLLGMGEGPGPRVLGGFSQLMPQSYDVMGWDVVEEGLKVRFSRSIPALVRNHLPALVREGLAQHGLSPEEIGAWTLHPGGAKVLQAYQEGLGIDAGSLEVAWAVLREFGNMSSPTVLFVLAEQMRGAPPPGPGVLLALGPGFAAEGVVLLW
ncbi:MAG: stilbene synthase [Meiothermus sp.]|uniref:type III polyketide synthase n=1 Tax=Meiothermus sp. TaxID=1955249 RepID=UPI0025F4418E|nr:3-oxoacyl-[acyl-carrier-protein] synthase III C-terminal domain-containing protein [Meiothermus sp.]MCS7195510.1 stilbene synthase [Meiothermus sp.]MDW8090438.1 3-oxoacyl-[acyl-carrier-protein] synthase III C-terminal domain-containing protein [Meiothermus sp.]